MDDTPIHPEVGIGDVVKVGFAWGGRVGKVVATFGVELLRLERRNDDGRQRTSAELARLHRLVKNPFDFFVGRIVEFRTCWYEVMGEFGQEQHKSDLLTTLAELPEALRREVEALLGTEYTIAWGTAQFGLMQYIPCPRD